MNIIVVGGGWAGCAAALAAKKCGANVILFERTDLLLGTGLVGGIYRNNGRFTATEEMNAMGGAWLFEIMDKYSRHKDISFPGHRHASVYDVNLIEAPVRESLLEAGVDIRFDSRIVDVSMAYDIIESVKTEEGETFAADAFVDATGTFGPQGNCVKHGHGCAMCIMRCPSYGPRIGISVKAGVPEYQGKTAAGTVGSMSGSCKLLKESLDNRIVEKLEGKGAIVIPLPEKLVDRKKLEVKACQQYALPEFSENLILIDSGHAKLMSPYFPLSLLRGVPGFEKARYADPYSGGKGNSMRFMSVSRCGNDLKAENVENLFCAGERAGLFVGHTEAVCTGILAGHNAARKAADLESLVLSDNTVLGYMIAFSRLLAQTPEGHQARCTLSGSVFFESMKEQGLYSIDREAIARRIANEKLTDCFSNLQ